MELRNIFRVVNQLNAADIFVSDVLHMEHPQLAQALDDSDSDIVVSLLPKNEVQ